MRPGEHGHEELELLAELAPLQVLDADDQRRLNAHLGEGCEACRERMSQGAEAVDVLVLTGPTAIPSPDARAALLRAVADRGEPHAAASRATHGRSEGRWGWRIVLPAMAASLALLLAGGAYWTALRTEREAATAVRSARAELDARLAERERELESLSARLAGFEEALGHGGDAAVREVTLVGEAAFGSAGARVVVDRAGNQVLLLASRLPPAPAGHTYQLWVIVSGAPHSMGVFDADAEGRALHVESEQLQLDDDDFSVAISVEPDGGVPQPTGPIVLASH